MRLNQFFRKTHKWVGIVLSVVFLNLAVTGILLLEKKNVAWIQPPIVSGADGAVEDFISTQKLLEVVLAADNPNFQSADDIDRIDCRPDKRVFKVISKHSYAEIQVDAVTAKILSTAWRPSDLLEDLHDGSYYAEVVHAALMPVTAAGLTFLTITGLYFWLSPKIRKRRNAKP